MAAALALTLALALDQAQEVAEVVGVAQGPLAVLVQTGKAMLVAIIMPPVLRRVAVAALEVPVSTAVPAAAASCATSLATT